MCEEAIQFSLLSQSVMNNPKVVKTDYGSLVHLQESPWTYIYEINRRPVLATPLNPILMYSLFMACKLGKDNPLCRHKTWREALPHALSLASIHHKFVFPSCRDKYLASAFVIIAAHYSAIKQKAIEPKDVEAIVKNYKHFVDVDGLVGLNPNMFTKNLVKFLSRTYTGTTIGYRAVLPIKYKDIDWYAELASQLASTTTPLFPFATPLVTNLSDVAFLVTGRRTPSKECLVTLAGILTIIMKTDPQIHSGDIEDAVRKAYAKALYAGLIFFDKDGIYLDGCYLGSSASEIISEVTKYIDFERLEPYFFKLS